MKHYRVSRYQAIDVIEDWQLDFAQGNVLKYLARSEHKGCTRQDMIKALWYMAYAVTRDTAFADRVAQEAGDNGETK